MLNCVLITLLGYIDLVTTPCPTGCLSRLTEASNEGLASPEMYQK